VACIGLQGTEVFEVARVGERIQREHGLIAIGQPIEDEVATDEAGGASYQYHANSKRK
jgi:hypothetical protein